MNAIAYSFCCCSTFIDMQIAYVCVLCVCACVCVLCVCACVCVCVCMCMCACMCACMYVCLHVCFSVYVPLLSLHTHMSCSSNTSTHIISNLIYHQIFWIGGDIPVTNSNREEYVHLYVQHILDTSIAPQFEAFRKGSRRFSSWFLFSFLNTYSYFHSLILILILIFIPYYLFLFPFLFYFSFSFSFFDVLYLLNLYFYSICFVLFCFVLFYLMMFDLSCT